MADVLVLLSSPAAVQRVHRALEMDAAAGTRHVPRRCRDWVDLLDHAPRSPLGVAVVDPYHGGALAAGEIRRLRERAPRVEVVAYGAFSARPSDPFALARLGVRAVVSLGVDDTPGALRECLSAHLNATPLEALIERLGQVAPPRVLPWLEPVLRSPAAPATAAGVARLARCSPRTLRRTLLAAGLPPAGELLAWRRLLHAARLMEDAHWSVDGVARALGCSSGSALRKSLRTLTGLRPGEVIARGGLSLIADLFLQRCTRAPGRARAVPPPAASDRPPSPVDTERAGGPPAD